MSRAGDKAYRLRYWLLAAFVLVEGGLAGALVLSNEGDIGAVIATTVFFGVQYIFLGRRENWPIVLAQKSRPLRQSVIFGAFIAGGVMLGLITTILELIGVWDEVGRHIDLAGFLGAAAVMWVGWLIVFAFLWPGVDRYTWLGKMVRRLIVGSILELLASISVQAFVPDRHNCGCARGSFFGIIIGGVALLWAFGPGVVLVFLYEKVRMERGIIHRRCSKCDYDLRGTLDAGRPECPECGTPVATR